MQPDIFLHFPTPHPTPTPPAVTSHLNRNDIFIMIYPGGKATIYFVDEAMDALGLCSDEAVMVVLAAVVSMGCPE